MAAPDLSPDGGNLDNDSSFSGITLEAQEVTIQTDYHEVLAIACQVGVNGEYESVIIPTAARSISRSDADVVFQNAKLNDQALEYTSAEIALIVFGKLCSMARENGIDLKLGELENYQGKKVRGSRVKSKALQIGMSKAEAELLACLAGGDVRLAQNSESDSIRITERGELRLGISGDSAKEYSLYCLSPKS